MELFFTEEGKYRLNDVFIKGQKLMVENKIKNNIIVIRTILFKFFHDKQFFLKKFKTILQTCNQHHVFFFFLNLSFSVVLGELTELSHISLIGKRHHPMIIVYTI